MRKSKKLDVELVSRQVGIQGGFNLRHKGTRYDGYCYADIMLPFQCGKTVVKVRKIENFPTHIDLSYRQVVKILERKLLAEAQRIFQTL